MPAITAAELAELPRLTREQIAAPTEERGRRVRELFLARPANYDYHKAYIVARILSSERLRGRARWTRFAQELIQDPGVENRLIGQAMNLIRLQKIRREASLAVIRACHELERFISELEHNRPKN
jgi:hypothetical protein